MTGNLKEAWSQLLASLGQPILQGAVNIVKKAYGMDFKACTMGLKPPGQVLGDLFGWSSDNSTRPQNQQLSRLQMLNRPLTL